MKRILLGIFEVVGINVLVLVGIAIWFFFTNGSPEVAASVVINTILFGNTWSIWFFAGAAYSRHKSGR